MRSFSVLGPYNLNISLSTVLPGDFSISFPKTRRASSEPIRDSASKNTRENFAEHYTMAISDEEESQQARAPSPTPTEIDDPEPEAILEDLKRLGIKVRDYAYPQSTDPGPSQAEPATSAYAAPTSSPSSSNPMYGNAATEVFDQYKGIAEFEFRLRQDPRTYPIQGKTLRRLLDLGWASMGECKQRLHQMDWEAMKDYDAVASEYPWKPCKWSTVPDAVEREQLLASRGAYFVGVDRVRWQMEALEEREARERVLVEEAEERMRIMEEKRQAEVAAMAPLMNEHEESLMMELEALPLSKKRGLERSASTPSCPSNSACQSFSVAAGPKRARLDGQTSALGSATTKPLPVPPAPPKQYPAPLSSYDPALYPEAASVIGAEARPPLPPQREDTPPLDSGESDGESALAGNGHPLQRRRKGLKRSLSRTQTFTQL